MTWVKRIGMILLLAAARPFIADRYDTAGIMLDQYTTKIETVSSKRLTYWIMKSIVGRS